MFTKFRKGENPDSTDFYKKMKKIKVISLCVALALIVGSLCGCQVSKPSQKDDVSTKTATETEAKGNSATSAETKICTMEFEGIANAWSLGGYVSLSGKKVKDNLLYRAGKLSAATEADIAKLKEEYNVSTIVDFRSEEEAAAEPDPEIEGIENISVPVLEAGSVNQQAVVEIYRKNGNDVGKMYLEMVRAGVLHDEMYTAFFNSDKAMQGFRKFFDVLLSQEEGAVLWHCTGGKDRTGIAAIMLLTLLDVDKDTIFKDFTHINELNKQKMDYIASEVKKHTNNEEEIQQAAILSGVSPEHMNMVYENAEKECGSMKKYIQTKVGITDEEVEKLCDMYLE